LYDFWTLIFWGKRNLIVFNTILPFLKEQAARKEKDKRNMKKAGGEEFLTTRLSI